MAARSSTGIACRTHRRGIGRHAWGYIVGTYDKDAGPNNERLYLNGTRVAQMSDALPIDLNSAALGIGRHVSGIADPFNDHIDEFRSAHVQRFDRDHPVLFVHSSAGLSAACSVEPL